MARSTTMMSEVCSNVSTKPHHWPLTGELKLFDLGLQTLTPVHDLIMLLMASGMEGLTLFFLMFSL